MREAEKSRRYLQCGRALLKALVPRQADTLEREPGPLLRVDSSTGEVVGEGEENG